MDREWTLGDIEHADDLRTKASNFSATGEIVAFLIRVLNKYDTHPTTNTRVWMHFGGETNLEQSRIRKSISLTHTRSQIDADGI